MATVDEFINALQYDWLQKALISAILIGLVCALIGVFIVMRGVIFLGEAISHSAFAGAALALLLGFENILFMILIFGVVTAIGIGYVNEKDYMKDEIVIGITFTFFMALAIFFIGLMKTYNSNVQSILFGRILLITDLNFYLLIAFSAVILLVLFGLKKELYTMAYSNELAIAAKIPVRLLNYVFLILVALTIDISLNAIGAILVFAMLIIPAAAAYQLTYKFNKLLVLSAFFGITSSIGGLFLAYLYDWASGATIVLLATLFFGMSFVLSPKRNKLIQKLLRKEDYYDVEPEIQKIPHHHGKEEEYEAFEDHLRQTLVLKEEYKNDGGHE